jgi:hypothetical protein
MISPEEVNEFFENAKLTVQELNGFEPVALMFDAADQLRVLQLAPLLKAFPDDSTKIRDSIKSLVIQSNIETVVAILEINMSVELDGHIDNGIVLLLNAVDNQGNDILLISQKFVSPEGYITFVDIDVEEAEYVEPLEYLENLFNGEPCETTVHFTEHVVEPFDAIDEMLVHNTIPVNRTLH